MNYLKFPLGWQETGAVAVARFQGVESDVFLVDSFNLNAFERVSSSSTKAATPAVARPARGSFGRGLDGGRDADRRARRSPGPGPRGLEDPGPAGPADDSGGRPAAVAGVGPAPAP